jgi:hypothetical protein
MIRQQASNGGLVEMKFLVPQRNHLLLQPSVTGVGEIGPAVDSARLRAAKHRLSVVCGGADRGIIRCHARLNFLMRILTVMAKCIPMSGLSQQE